MTSDGAEAASGAHSPDYPATIPGTALGGLVVTGFLLILHGDALADALTRALPQAVTVKSAGTFYPALDEALPFMLRGLGASVLFAVLAGFLACHWSIRWKARQRWEWAIVAGLGIVAAALYGWLSLPHNAFPTNARVHWVDIFFDRQDNYFYTLVKLHAPFYDYPHIFQALNGAVNVCLIYLIGRSLSRSLLVPAVMALSYVGAGLMLVFANGAEDVSLGVTTLLAVLLLYLRRRSPWVGLGLFVATLARPQFIFLLFAFVAAELLERERTPGSGILSRYRFLWQNLLVFGAAFVLWNGWLVATGNNWLLTAEGLIATPLLGIEPQEIDGFLLHRFSGAYVGHLAWLLPVPLVVGNVIAVVRRRALDPDARRALWLVAGFAALNLAFLEYHVMHYYNVRYLSYLFPLLLVTAWFPVVLNQGEQELGWRRAGAVALLALAPLTQYQQGFHARQNVAEHPVATVFEDRQQLRELADDRPIRTTIESHTHRNYLAYVFRRPHESIRVVEQGRVGRDGSEESVVVTRSLEGYEDLRVLYDNGKVKVVRADPGTRPEGGP